MVELKCLTCIHGELCLYKHGGVDLSIISGDCKYYKSSADVVPKSEVEKIEKESSAFAEIIHKQEDEIQQLRKSLLTKQALEEEFSKSVKKIEKQALKTIEKAKQEVEKIFEEIERSTINSNFEFMFVNKKYFAELKKKYTKGSEDKE